MADATLELMIKANADMFSKEMGKVNSQLERLNKSYESSSKKSSGVFSGVLGANVAMKGISLVTGALGSFASEIVSGAAKMETYKTSFTTMLGSVDKANELLAQVKQFGAETPFEFPELADSTKKLLAFGVAQQDILPSLTKIGDIASGVGMPISELSEIFGKAKVSGTLFAEDINQLTGRGIPIIQEFAKQLGVSEGEVKKLASQGKITFPMLDQAFTDLTTNGGRFAGMMEAQSKTFEGMLSTLKDSIGEVAVGIGNSLMPFLKQMIEVFNKLLPIITPIIDQFVKFLAPILEDIANNIVVLLKPLGNLISTLLSGLQPVIALLLKGINRMIPALVKIIEAVNQWFIAMKPLTDMLMKQMIDQMDNFIPLLNSLASIMVSLTPIVNLLAKSIALTMEAIAWANNGLMEVFVATLESMSWVIEQIVDGLVAMGLLEDTVVKPTRQLDDATLKATNSIMGMGESFDITADAAQQNGIMVATTAGAYNVLTQKTDQNTNANNKNTGSLKDKLKALREQDELNKKMKDHYDGLNDSMSEMFRNMEKESAERAKRKKEVEEELRQILAKNKIQLVGPPPKSRKQQEDEANEQKLADDTAKEMEIAALRRAKAYELIGQAAQMSGQMIGSAFVAGDVEWKDSLKTILTAMIDFVQVEYLAAQAAMAIKALFTSGFSLTTDMVLSALAYGALEIAKGAVASFAVGTTAVPQDGLGYLHKNEMIVPRTFNEALQAGQITISGGSQAKPNDKIKLDLNVSYFDKAVRYSTYKADRVRI